MNGTGNNLPESFTTVSPEAWTGIFIYTGVFVVAAIGNVSAFVCILNLIRRRPSPMNKLLLHLNIADLIVVFVLIPSEIGWRLSIGWYAGDIPCRLVQYFRVFGLYLSALIVTCITLNRYYAVLYPLRSLNGNNRVRIMIYSSWIGATLCSAPQVVIFRVASHPEYNQFFQCVSDSLGEKGEIANGIFNLVVLYFVPLVTIIFSYGSILHKITQDSVTTVTDDDNVILRRSGASVLERARTRTTILTGGIIIVFLIFWTPYVIVVLWELIDGDSLVLVSSYLQDLFFIMVLGNSTFNPLVYGWLYRAKNSRRIQRGFGMCAKSE
ncbi:unnamed protein product [Allacma fusca]|uniref:G-protein coupled receptors family 1 profile domain-containing protein n=1 Tax=Allacma fusca TaxID=39272 RepID=A0A8J2PFQ1_9HEXA|nr:unnamed protein product [Allacma fusca]